MSCKHAQCDYPVAKAGYCNAHYIRKRRGRPMDGPIRKAVDDPLRFWDKVDKTPGCWNWTAYRGADGYGRFMINRVPRLAHRVSYELANALLPPDLEVDHMCHNRACVNPDHLRLATRSLNGQNLRQARVDSSTGIRGVRYRKDTGRWSAQAQVDCKPYYLGTFATAAEAEAAVVEFRRTHMPFSLMDQTGAA